MYLDPTLIDCEFPILYRNFLCMFIFSFASFTFHVYLSPPKFGLSDRFSPRVCTVLPPPLTFYDTIGILAAFSDPELAPTASDSRCVISCRVNHAALTFCRLSLHRNRIG